MILTRRKVLEFAGAGAFSLTAAGVLAPKAAALIWRGGSASGSSGATFDFYISTTGSDSNPGTLASPWAITAINTKQSTYAGKRVGLIAGTYDISSLMNATFHNPVLNINGGSAVAPTYIGSSDASGYESPRSATLDAKGASGFYGGGNGNISSMLGQAYETNVPANKGYFTISGLRFIGYSLWAVHIGTYTGASFTPTNISIQNCEFTGQVASNVNSSIGNGTNLASLVVYTAQNLTVTNNYFHDNVGYYVFDKQHFAAVYQWGLGDNAGGGSTSLDTVNTAYTYNTIVNSGNIISKEATQYNNEVAYNYIDMTGVDQTSAETGCGTYGWMADFGRGTLTTVHHNIIKHRGAGISVENTNLSRTYVQTPFKSYNNTLIAVDLHASAALMGGYVATGNGGITHQVSHYNNLYYDNGVTVNAYGYVMTSIDMFALSDYNIYGGWNLWGSVPDSNDTSSPGLVSYHSLATFQTAFGTDAGSITSTTDPFTGVVTGLIATQYQLAAGYAHRNFGHVGGTSGGAACDAGAWDGTVTRIGCDFA